MGKFHEKLDANKDTYMIAKVDIEIWLSEFALDYSNAGSFAEKIQAIKKWFGS